MKPYDLIVIGSGPWGQRAAIQGAKAGKGAAVIEKHSAIGGVCINTGTIPSPRLLEFADTEIVEALSYQMRDHRATMRLNEEVESVEEMPDGRVRRREVSRQSGS